METKKITKENTEKFEELKKKLTNKFNEYVSEKVNVLNLDEVQIDNITFEIGLDAVIQDANKKHIEHPYFFIWQPDLDPYFKLLEKQFIEITNRKNFVRFGGLNENE